MADPSGARTSRLLVCVPELVSEWIAKGEIVDRYYNPGDLFDEVHLLLTNDDAPPAEPLQRLVGRATPIVHNLPAGKQVFVSSLGFRPRLLRRWASAGVELARAIQPDLVRCHGVGLNAFVAHEIKRSLGVPYAVSLHINPDEDVRGRTATWQERLRAWSMVAVERVALRDADAVLPVYEAIVPYLRRAGAGNVQVAYNVLNAAHLRRKSSYELARPPSVVSVGRQFDAKDPEPIIRAVARIEDLRLHLIGDGPIHHRLRNVAAELGVDERVTFTRRLENDVVCATLADHDVFVVHSEYWELSKAVIEALLAGLPVVANLRRGDPVPELTRDIAVLVEPTADAYEAALRELLGDASRRASLGRSAAAAGTGRWAPSDAEQRVVDIYRDLLAG